MKAGKDILFNARDLQKQDALLIINNNLTKDNVVPAIFGHEIDHTSASNVMLQRAEKTNPRLNSEHKPDVTTNAILKDIVKKLTQ